MSWVQLEVFCRLHKSSLTMSCRNLQNPRRKRLQGPSGEDNYGAPDRFSLTDLAVPVAVVHVLVSGVILRDGIIRVAPFTLSISAWADQCRASLEVVKGERWSRTSPPNL